MKVINPQRGPLYGGSAPSQGLIEDRGQRVIFMLLHPAFEIKCQTSILPIICSFHISHNYFRLTRRDYDVRKIFVMVDFRFVCDLQKK